MRGWCPHCGEINEYARPPASAVVYCQHCKRPFGSLALTASHTNTSDRPSDRPPRAVGDEGLSPAITERHASAARADATNRPQLHARDSRRPPDPVFQRVIVPSLSPRAEGQQSARPRLIYRSVEGMETEFVVERTTTIGRHPKNSVRLHDREVSKEHAVIEQRGESFVLRDLNSSNGSFVNDRRVKEAALRDGDILLLGSMQLVFRASSPEPARDSARDLVTILPANPSTATHIHATLDDLQDEQDFRPSMTITDIDVLRRDYDKLRVMHELARMGITMDFSALLARTLEVAFSILRADNGVILVVDPETGVLLPHTVRRREGQREEEIVLSSTIINQVINDRKSVLLSDAFLDPRFSAAQSIISQGIRSAMVVPLVANNTVYGVLHLDSRERIGAFTEKDLQLLKTLGGQAAVAIANTRLLRKVEEDAKTRGQLSRFLPPHVVEQMVQGRGQPISKGGRERDASVLFCDIRGFTPMSEQSSPQEVVDFLNDYFERLVEIVFQFHGVLDKFIGDAMMAHWGTLDNEDGSDHAQQAVVTALALRGAIRALNQEREQEGRAAIGVGIGINSGRLVAGYIGAKRRLEYTVVGDTVNTSSRLCGIAEADQILIAESTHERMRGRYDVRYLGTRQLKGKEQEVKVYEVLGTMTSPTERRS